MNIHGMDMSSTQPDGYLATLQSTSGAPVLVLHAWWGLNNTIKSICDNLAKAGFLAFAPDLYHGKIADTIPEAEELGSALDEKYLQAKAEIAEAVQFLCEEIGVSGCEVSVVAFSLGAYYALDLAASDPEHIRSVVLFYGSGPVDHSTSRARYLGHFADKDPYEPRENVEDLEKALRTVGRPVTFYTYEGTGHWFFEPDRKDAYDKTAAQLAWERTLEFLKTREIQG
ncbi:MAG: dienelactone hydrolase family protein [Candidatus Thorarchaeota archaeon]